VLCTSAGQRALYNVHREPSDADNMRRALRRSHGASIIEDRDNWLAERAVARAQRLC
jgi:hypothetical protein